MLIASVPVLPLLAAPLALLGGPRRQRSGIAIGLLILIVYYEALNFGEALAKRELLAAGIGLWLPFLALAAGAGWLFLRSLRGAAPSGALRAAAADARNRNARMASVLSRYIARRLLARAAVLMSGLAALMMRSRLPRQRRSGDRRQRRRAAADPALHGLLRLPEIVAQMLPITAILAGLLTFADLARHSELTAMAAAGVSKARLALAVLPVALLIAGGPVPDRGSGGAGRGQQAPGLGHRRLRPGRRRDALAWLRHGDDILRIRAFDPAARTDRRRDRVPARSGGQSGRPSSRHRAPPTRTAGGPCTT